MPTASNSDSVSSSRCTGQIVALDGMTGIREAGLHSVISQASYEPRTVHGDSSSQTFVAQSPQSGQNQDPLLGVRVENTGSDRTGHRNASDTNLCFSVAEFTDDDDKNYDPDYSVDDEGPMISTNQYVLLRQAQDAIGWDHFFRGKWAMHWTTLQYRYAVKHSLLDKSRNWHTWLIKYMATQAFNLWSLRNKKRHGFDSTTQYQAQLEQAR